MLGLCEDCGSRHSCRWSDPRSVACSHYRGGDEVDSPDDPPMLAFTEECRIAYETTRRPHWSVTR